MKIKIAIMCSTLVFSPSLLAGSLDSPAAPTDAGNAMFTLEDIYNRLNDGTAGSKRTGAFVEPSSGPTAGTGHTLDEVMSKTPVINVNGATSAQVLQGRFFWGLLGGTWGLQPGTATAGDNVTGSSLSMTIRDGFYSGSKTATASDTNLTAANIKKDVAIFGVTGTYEAGLTCTGILNGTRWCDNENGTVTDMTTGLVWLKKADWGGQKQWDGNSNDNAHVRAGILLAGEANANLSDGSVEGDWRLPTKSELVGITTGDETVSSSNMRALSGVLSNIYWSSSIVANDTTNAWYVGLYDGGVGSYSKPFTAYV